jgi:hypothetical protein
MFMTRRCTTPPGELADPDLAPVVPPSCELLDSRRRALAKKPAPPLRGAWGTYGRMSSVGVVGVVGIPGEGNGVLVFAGLGDAIGPLCG